MSSLSLYTDSFRDSPWVFTAWIALTEKRLPFELVDVDLRRQEHKQPQYVERSLTGKVPVLRHDEFWLSESLAIAEYLAEAFPVAAAADTAAAAGHIFPTDLKARARCRQLMLWLRTDLTALRRERPTSSIFYPATQAELLPLSADAQSAAAELVRLGEVVVQRGRLLLFDSWCLADADLCLALMRLHANGYTLPDGLREYTEAQWERPSVKAFRDLPRPRLE